MSSAILRIDLHSHTHFSRDAWTSPGLLLERAEQVGLDRIAVTDHGEVEGALRARQLEPERVIVGEEIMCADGTEVIGLFLDERIPCGLSVAATAELIHGQGGVVYAPHPFAYRSDAPTHAAAALEHADLVEIYNSRAFLPSWNRRAGQAAVSRRLPGFAGSDAHFPWEIGRACTEVPEFRTATELLRVASRACPRPLARSTMFAHVASLSLSAARRYVALAPPAWSSPDDRSTVR